ncbi:hypothetical protein SAMN05444920_120107 [Nonomuraea solani]|uniref:Uncharacterized protein n=2 Tax=Nonomuraea solani TaxID=1144553 RepID=A0A1H6EVH9_9ACTN|nr:hypothetical protein SAMN05444920_120107 [Nonomuraea solani]
MEARGQTAEIMIAEARKAFWVMTGFIAVIWILQIFNWLSGYALGREFALRAWVPESLPDILRCTRNSTISASDLKRHSRRSPG